MTQRMFALIITISLMAACASPVDEATLSPEQRQLRQEARAFKRTVWEGIIVGAATGAAIGAISGILSKSKRGEQKGEVRKRALMGAGAGAAAGGLAGAYLAEKQKEFASKEDVLDSLIADVQKKNDEARTLITTMEVVVEEDRRRLAELEEQYREGLVEDAEYRRQLNIVEDDKRVIKDAIKQAEDQIKVFKDAREEYAKTNPDADFSEYDKEIAALEQQVATMTVIAGRIG